MIFIAGFITGISVSVLIFVILAFFRAAIEQRIKVIEKYTANAGPRVKGGIFLPEEDADAARREHIERNQAQGKDTPIEELK